MLHSLISAAPAAGANGMQVLGAVGLSSLALTMGAILIMAIRGRSKPVKKFLGDARRLGGAAVVFGVLCIMAGGTWRAIAYGAQDMAARTLADPNVAGGITPAGTALFLTTVTFLPEWQKLFWPLFFGIGAGVSWGIAGGYFGILYDLIGSMLGRLA
ncbi:hypothetical protein [Streptomyces sp. TRM68367]|uniref:hypothetical protein n=1 Tax=Streptomyces sp. TRM68367 TaxID=2758415 RepID=UPI00165B6535|nr:hypothetical protein [Streptomyces sp. TRM68367]MBC9731231.1 hypothetical protein [Streptomyces sp. TRM68367]